jgi:hypothetical protein
MRATQLCCPLGAEHKVPKSCVHRQLDDVPVVSGKGTGWTELFTAKYKEVCEKVKVPLAPDCERHEKAFGPTTFGTVLGVNFDSAEMTWSLPATKEAVIQQTIDDFCARKTCTLLEIQKLHGKLSDFALSCDFMLGFRHHLIQVLGKFGQTNGDAKKLIQ